MSLINKMLNELEKNKQSDGGKRAEILSSINLATQKYKLLFERKIIIIVWTSLLVIMAGIFLYLHSPKSTAKITNPVKINNSTKTVPTIKSAQPNEIKKTVASLEPTIKLKNITLQTANDKTIIDFILSAVTSYYIEHSADNQQLFITLSNTGLLGNIPFTLENSFVIASNIKQSGTSIICTLTLLPGTKVDELQLIDKLPPVLHLVLSNPQLTSSKMSKVPIPISREQQEEQRYQNILQLLTQNKTKEAITQLHLFIGDYAGHLQAREILVALLIKEGLLAKADDILMIGLNKNPKHAPFIKLKAHILTEEGKTNDAIHLLQKFSSLFTDDPEYFALLAVLYYQYGQFMRSAELYNQLTKIQPQKAAWWVGLGAALENAGKKNAAQEAYHRASNSSDITPDLVVFLSDKIKK